MARCACVGGVRRKRARWHCRSLASKHLATFALSHPSLFSPAASPKAEVKKPVGKGGAKKKADEEAAAKKKEEEEAEAAKKKEQEEAVAKKEEEEEAKRKEEEGAAKKKAEEEEEAKKKAEEEAARNAEREAALAEELAKRNGKVTCKYEMYTEEFEIKDGALEAAVVDDVLALSFVMPNCKIHLCDISPQERMEGEEEPGYEPRPFVWEEPEGTFRELETGKT